VTREERDRLAALAENLDRAYSPIEDIDFTALLEKIDS
jgi:hypothetical protein